MIHKRRQAIKVQTLFATVICAILAVGSALSLEAHDLFLKPNDFFVAPHASLSIRVLNGTFTTSEAEVTRSRLRDLSVAGPAGVTHPDTSTWTGSKKESTWRVGLAEAGTYVLGASVLPRTLGLTAKAFNDYLAEDGLPDILAQRRERNELERPARERYAKHVKTIVQVGDVRSNTIDIPLGYPAELVPLDNPYVLRRGDTFRVRALVERKPVPNMVVLAGGHTAQGKPIPSASVRTDADGVARIPIRTSGVWYVKFIDMRRIAPDARDSVDYESKWATLTFAIR